MSTRKNRSTPTPKPKPKKSRRRPRVLVLEGLSGAAQCVRRSGGTPISVSPLDVKRADKALAGEFDAVLLTGGGDVDPRLYGGKPHKKIYGVSQTRDLVEMCALEIARDKGVPVLGICRGHQMMVVEAGGTLIRHLDDKRGHRSPHLVFPEKGSALKRKTGTAFLCRSLHHQAVKDTGPYFRVAAMAKDGIVEGVESVDGRCVGVQFHPEMNYGTEEASRTIFREFILKAARVAGLAIPALPAVVSSDWDDDEDDFWYPSRYRRANRTAGTPTAPRGRAMPRGVTVSWFCPHCAIKFDRLVDRDDHVQTFHGPGTAKAAVARHRAADLQDQLLLEPPPDHPDWELEVDDYLTRP